MNRKQAEHDRTVLPRIQTLLAQGRSRREIAEQLQQDGVPTARRGGRRYLRKRAFAGTTTREARQRG